MKLQDEKKSLLLCTLCITFLLLLTFYSQQVLSDSSNSQNPFPSILFGDESDIYTTDFPDGVKTLPKKLPNNKSKQSIKTYGPVSNNESLWVIADKLRDAQDIMIIQMAIALFKHNPQAFLRNNINGLKNGVTLNVPGKNQVIQISMPEAELIFQQHLESWRKSREVKDNKPVNMSFSNDAGGEILLHDINKAKIAKPDLIKKESLIQTIDKKPDLKPVPAIKQTDAEKRKQRIDSNNTNEFVLLDYISNIQFQYIFKNIAHDFFKSLNLFWLDFELEFKNSFLQDSINSLPVRILLIVLFVLLSLVYYFRRWENKNTEFKPETSALEYRPLCELEIEKKTLFNRDTAELNAPPVLDTDRVKSHQSGSKQTNSEYEYIPVIEQNFEISTLVDEDETFATPPLDIVPIQVTINNFPELDSESAPELEIEEAKLSPLQQPENRMGLLEKAFENEDHFSETGFVQKNEEYTQGKEQINEAATSSSPLNSEEQIKYIHDMTRDAKIDAFLKMTQSDDEFSAESSIDDTLANEFFKINNNEKVSVFIEEFEQIIFSLTQQTPILEKDPNEMENVIQFKLSIHFVKVLSDMMQANYLKQLSQTVIELLGDIVDGKTQMSCDILSRLSNVVSFYDQYINFVKNIQQVKIEM